MHVVTTSRCSSNYFSGIRLQRFDWLTSIKCTRIPISKRAISFVVAKLWPALILLMKHKFSNVSNVCVRNALSGTVFIISKQCAKFNQVFKRL